MWDNLSRLLLEITHNKCFPGLDNLQGCRFRPFWLILMHKLVFFSEGKKECLKADPKKKIGRQVYPPPFFFYLIKFLNRYYLQWTPQKVQKMESVSFSLAVSWSNSFPHRSRHSHHYLCGLIEAYTRVHFYLIDVNWPVSFPTPKFTC